MEFKNPAQLRRIADVSTAAPKTMTRRERLDRWAELLARNPGRVLKTLEEIEFRPSRDRARHARDARRGGDRGDDRRAAVPLLLLRIAHRRARSLEAVRAVGRRIDEGLLAGHHLGEEPAG